MTRKVPAKWIYTVDDAVPWYSGATKTICSTCWSRDFPARFDDQRVSPPCLLDKSWEIHRICQNMPESHSSRRPKWGKLRFWLLQQLPRVLQHFGRSLVWKLTAIALDVFWKLKTSRNHVVIVAPFGNPIDKYLGLSGSVNLLEHLKINSWFIILAHEHGHRLKVHLLLSENLTSRGWRTVATWWIHGLKKTNLNITFDHFRAPCRFIVTFGSHQKTMEMHLHLSHLSQSQKNRRGKFAGGKPLQTEVLDSSNSSSCLMLAFSTVKPWGGWYFACKWIIFWGKPMGFSRCFCMFSRPGRVHLGVICVWMTQEEYAWIPKNEHCFTLQTRCENPGSH